jgi:hypothetical protein
LVREIATLRTRCCRLLFSHTAERWHSQLQTIKYANGNSHQYLAYAKLWRKLGKLVEKRLHTRGEAGFAK